MKKNCIILLMVLLLNMTVCSICSADDIAAQSVNPYSKYQDVLTALDLMSYNSEGEIDNSKEITRAEFVGVIAKLIEINPTVVATSSYFYDVPVDAWYTNALNTLTEYGIVDQNEEKMFYPNSVIKVNEANKMIVCLLGYKVFATQNGGYPSGFNAVGTGIGIFDGMPIGENMTNAHMSVMLYNTINADVVNAQYTAQGMELKVTDENILEQKRKIFKSDGVIESIYGLSLYGKNVTDMSKVVIDNTTYKTTQFEKLEKHFGEKVRFYFKEEEDDDLTLIYFEPYYQSDVTIEILSDDLVGFDRTTNVITYFNQSKKKKATLSSTAVVFRNEEIVKTSLDKAFDIKNGELKLIDSNDDGKYDVCCIYDFTTVVTNGVDVQKKAMTYKMISEEKENYYGAFDFSDSVIDYLTIYSSVGTVVDFAAITTNTVLDIAVSDDNRHVTIYINSDMIEGKVNSMSTGDEVMSIDGKDYDFYKNVVHVFNLDTNAAGKFKLNKYGKISYYENVQQAGAKSPVVYVMNVYKDEVEEEKCWVKYYDSTGEFHAKLTKNKIKLDGEMISYDLYDALSAIKSSVAIVTVNANDEIVEIDSANQTINEDDTAIKQLLAYDGTGAKWNTTTKMFDKTVVCSSDAVVFVVPPLTQEYEQYSDDKQSYSIGSLSDFVSNSANDVDCYCFGSTSYSNVIVLYKYKYQNTHLSRFMMVTGISEAVSESGEIVTRITGYQNGKLVSYDVTEQYKIGSEEDADISLAKGDIITVGKKDKDGVVGNVEVHFDVSRNWSGLNQICVGGYMFDSYANRNYDALYWWMYEFKDLQASSRFIFGCPVEVDGKLIKFAYPEVEGGKDNTGKYKWRQWNKPTDFKKYDEITILKDSTPIIVYDAQTDMITEGSVTDIRTADSYECPSQIFFDLKWGEIISVFVINNNDKAWTEPDVVEE